MLWVRWEQRKDVIKLSSNRIPLTAVGKSLWGEDGVREPSGEATAIVRREVLVAGPRRGQSRG